MAYGDKGKITFSEGTEVMYFQKERVLWKELKQESSLQKEKGKNKEQMKWKKAILNKDHCEKQHKRLGKFD